MMRPALALAAAAGVLSASVVGLIRGVEPFATWFYPLAWYPTLVAADAAIRLRTGRWHLLADPRYALSLLAWSVPFWLLFEAFNLRLQNWYYSHLEPDRAARWAGVVVSFATVLPAIVLSREALASFGFADGTRSRPFRVGRRLPGLLQAAGVGFFALALAWPRLFFPLVWGGVTLLADAWVYRRDPERSLLGALERGRPALPLQLLAGGLAIGFLWELYNTEARGKWIYTVPGLEELKLFEMPLLGFLGFPVLALDGWAAWHALLVGGLARGPRRTPADGASRDGRGLATGALTDDVGRADRPRGKSRRGRRAAAGSLAAVACALAISAMDARTVRSLRPELQDIVPAAPARALASGGYDAFTLAEADPARVAALTGAPDREARAWVERARLATLRGIGAPIAEALARVGVDSVEELAAADPDDLAAALERAGAEKVPPVRVRVWVRGARGRR